MPPGVRIAADWAWRLLLIVAALAVVVFVLAEMSEVSIPIAIAVLMCALLNPAKRFLIAKGWKRAPSTITVFVGGLLIVIGIITVVIQQFASGASDLAAKTAGGLDQIRGWLVTGPLGLSESQIDSAITSAKNALTDNKDKLTSGALKTATTAGHVLTGTALALFSLFFFLRDGEKIWAWLVGLMPRRARAAIDGAGTRAWHTLGGYIRATILVALVDAVGIGIVLFAVQVPLALPLAALVFLASFIPLIGATLSGGVAVLVALVTVGPVGALIVLAGVIAVQQLEGHVLQPILLGRAVQIHPLGVVLSIAAGVILAGITGALLAVPIVASINAAVKYLIGKDRDPHAGEDLIEQKVDQIEAEAEAQPSPEAVETVTARKK